ncbi:Ig-like domain-containing protein [Limnohabitans sp. DM1]|uniref:Ig-like domain-containing protein n=1 Tax=Limnohabitans sp. DM1 TaxID=1597955 RepID=UPI0021012872|nr:Ig-like domain-containing protein [Limnohabitans sp. DM1]
MHRRLRQPQQRRRRPQQPRQLQHQRSCYPCRPRSDSGVQGDNTTNDTTPAISGTGTAGEVITLKDAANAVIGTATVDVNGTWSITPSAMLPSGANTLSVTATSASNQISPATSLVITLDTTASAAPTAMLDASSDSGVLGDNTTNDTMPTISGTGTAGEVITVKDPAGAVIGTASVAANGTWSVTPTTALASGANNLSVTITDAAGNTSAATPLVITLDNTASAAPVATVDASSDSGLLGDQLTNDTTPTISGTGTAGEAITVKDSAGAVIGTATVAANGTWSVTPTAALASGANNLSVTTTDAAGNTSPVTPLVITFDTTASVAPTAMLDPSSDSGVLGDNTTDDTTPTISGTGTVGEIITLKDGANAVIGTATVATNGTWSITPTAALPSGANTLSVTTTDAAGNTSAPSALTVTITSTVQGNASISGMATGALSEDASVNSVSGSLTVTDPDSGENVLQTPASLAGVYGTFTLNTSSGAWTYTLDNSRDATQALAAQATVTDKLTVTSKDGTASQDISVLITGTDDAPVLSIPSAGPPGTAKSPANNTVMVPSNTNVAGLWTPIVDMYGTLNGLGVYKAPYYAYGGTTPMVVRDDNNIAGTANTRLDKGDILAADFQGYNGVVYGVAVGLRKLQADGLGAATLRVDIKKPDGTIISGVTTASSTRQGGSGGWDNGGYYLGSTIGNFTADQTGTYTMLIVGTSTAPVRLNFPEAKVINAAGEVIVNPVHLNYTEGQGMAAINTIVTVADVDDTSAVSAKVAITAGFEAAEDVLGFVNDGQTMGNITASLSPGVVRLSSAGGTATLAQWQAALRAVQYSNISDKPSTATRTVQYILNDGTLDSAVATSLIGVTPVKDAPVLTDTSLSLAMVAADAPVPTGAVGTLVSSLMGGVSLPDGTSTLKGMAITGVDTSQGTLFFSTNGGTTWTAVSSVSDANALLLKSDADNRLYFQPAAGVSNSIASAVTFRAWDQGVGAEGSYVDVSVNGGTSSFSSATDVLLQKLPVAVNLSDVAQGSGGFVINGDSASDRSGLTLSNAGDVNGDGYDDILVGAPGADVNGTPDAGRAYVVYGKTGNMQIDLSAVAAGVGGFAIDGFAVNDAVGTSVSAAGDVNQDGLADLVVISNNGNASPAGNNQGRAHVIFGSTSGATVSVNALTGSTGFSINGVTDIPSVGLQTVSAAGDVNGDGLEDFLVGTLTADVAGMTDAGKAYVVFGRTNNSTDVELSAVAAGSGGFMVQAQSAADLLGASISNAGDVNGDGLADLIVGATMAHGKGASYVVLGKTGGETVSVSSLGSQGFVIFGECAGDQAARVSNAGDVNGDGLADLIVGASDSDLSNGSNAGRSYVVFGRTGAVTEVQLSAIAAGSGGFVINGQCAGDAAGAVGYAGDVNGDGLADLMVGASAADPAAGTDAGRAYVVYGKTSTSAIQLSNLAQGEGGFFINGQSAGDLAGTVSLGGDINGDGFADVLVSAAHATTEGGTLAGQSYVVWGGSRFMDTLDLSGQLAADTLTGSTVSDTFVAGDGADVLIGNGGADVMYGGKGNDTFVLNAANVQALHSPMGQGGNAQQLARIDGGTGYDTLQLSGGAALNLGAVSHADAASPDVASRIEGLERIDLATDTASNTLGLGAKDVADLAGFNSIHTGSASADGKTWVNVSGSALSSITPYHQLVVDGNAQDALNLQTGPGDWANVGTVNDGLHDHVVFQNEALHAQVIVRQGVAVYGANDATGNPSNAAPVLTDRILSLGLLGDVATDPAGEVGSLVSSFMGGVSDADGAAALQGMAITGVDTSQGSLYYSTNGGLSWAQVSAVSDHMALLLGPDSDNRIYFKPNAGVTTNISSAVTWRAWDQTLGSEGVYVDVLAGAGLSATAAFSSTTDQIAQNFVPKVNLSSVAQGVGGFVINGQCAGDLSGFSVANAGDVNGDGYDDLIVGAPYADTSVNNSGRAYVVFGKSGTSAVNLSGLAAASAGFVLEGFGITFSAASVAAAGDVNGDGLADLMSSAHNEDGTHGRTYIVYGKTSSTAVQASAVNAGNGGYTIIGYTSSGQLFSSGVVSAAGDVNGDGLTDFLVGASRMGKTYLVFGSTDMAKVQLTAVQEGSGGFVINAQSSGDFTGYSASNAGDVNGDGLADVIVGTYNSDPATGTDAGRSFVVFGKTDSAGVNLSALQAGSGGFVIQGQCANDLSGFSVSQAGDVNGDGLGDVLVFAPQADPAAKANAGSTYVVYGKTDGQVIQLSAIAAGMGGYVIYGQSAGDGVYLTSDTQVPQRTRVSYAGDINGDGLADLIIGSQLADPATGVDAGRSFLVYGQTTNTPIELSAVANGVGGFVINGQSAGDNAGIVSMAGDINGDGFDDLLVGARTADPSAGADAGKSYVIFGGSQWGSQVDLLGDATANLLEGNTSSETFIAGDGHDSLIGNGGADVMFGGKGDDRFMLNASNVSALQSPLGAGGNVGQLARVMGGTGFDTLALSAGASLNLQSVSNADSASPDGMSRIESIERIDLASDSAANTLGLSAQDVVDMAGFNSIHTGTPSADGKTWTNASGNALADSTRYHQLVVEGDAADVLNLQLGTGLWVNAGTVNDGTRDYTVYQNEGMRSQVIVRTGLTVNNLDSVAPVVLDMNRDGILSYSQVQMDVNGDGLQDQSAWAAPQDGVLVWDKFADAMVHDHSQFAFAQYADLLVTPGATDLQGLAAAFDSNGDGVLNAQDSRFAQMAVWQDANHNGQSDSGEVRHLLDVGIVSLQLHSDGVLRSPAAGVQEAGRTHATWLDGSQLLVADAAFAFSSGGSSDSGSGLQWRDVLASADSPQDRHSGAMLGASPVDTHQQFLIDQAQLMTH